MPARRASLPTLAFRQQLSPPLSLSLIVHESRKNGKGDAMQRGASFSASQPSALICLSDACSTVLRLCSQRKHRTAAFLLKKPFNLGFKALPGRVQPARPVVPNARGLHPVSRFLNTLPQSHNQRILPSQPENTPPRAATNTVNKQCWPGNPTSRPVNYSVNKSNMLLCFSQVCGGLQQRERLLQQAERMQVSQTSNIIDDGWCNRALCRQ